jgi:hypothetical protein
MAGKVRPFEWHSEVGGHPVVVQGVIENGRFVITAELICLEVPTVRHGKDERGDFAIIDEGEWSQPDGMVLKVEPDYDSMPLPDGTYRPSGLEISKVRPPPPRTLGDLEVRVVMETGELPESFNLVVPNSWCISIQFDSQGNCDGFSSFA